MRKTLSILLSLIMVFSVFTVIPITTAGAAESYAITVANGITKGTISVPESAVAGSLVTIIAEPEGDNALQSISVKAEANRTFSASLTALDGIAPDNSNETYTKLVDGNTRTKWCLNFEGTPYIILKAEKSVSMSGYSLTTANDTASQSGRNWKDWTIYGANFDSDSDAVQDSSEWQVVTSVTDDSTLQAVNYTKYDFALDVPADAYQYYMIKITANHGNGMIQMSEFGMTYTGDDYIQDVDVSGSGNTRTFTMPPAPVLIDATFDSAFFYLDANGDKQILSFDAAVIASSSTSLSAGWYTVTSDTEINSRITCSGDVNLILCNGKKLTAHKGITVSGNNNSLTIYGQPEEENKETGKLIIDQVDDNNAGIGGGTDGSGSNITINGGTVTATGGIYGSGIGGGWEGSGENITINGGTVNANGGDYAAGIGGGWSGISMGGSWYGSGENITINGGTVNANGGDYAAGIGGGWGGSGNNITINGGTVAATGGGWGAGIGGGRYGSGNNITINGGTVAATGGEYAAGIGGGRYGSGGSIRLSWTNLTDSITAGSYNGTVTLEKLFTDGEKIYDPGVVKDNSLLANKRLSVPKYTITWENWDDTVLETDEGIFYGSVPTYDGAAPTKESDAQHAYIFAGWTDGTNIYDAYETLPAVTDDTTYTAVFVPEGYSGYASILTEPMPKPNLVYSGEPIELINAGTAKHGTMVYKLNDGEWSAELPAAIDPGTYTVTYKAIGDAGYIDTEEKTLIAIVRDGSEDYPYLITSAADWNAFVDKVNSGNTYEGKFIKLTKDIEVSRIAGDSREHIFKGTFDGDGHTVTVDITDNSTQGAALFRSIADATIKNLTVAGTVNSTQYHAAGLFGFAESGTNLIESCTVSATINGGDYAGGVYGHGIKSTVIVKNCVFGGLINGKSNATLGVFQGWSDDNTCTVDNCLYIQQNGQATKKLAYVKNVASLTVNNCYKTGSTIDNNGLLAYSITCEESIERLLDNGTNYPNGLTTYADAKAFGGVGYAPAGASIKAAVSDVGEENGISVNESVTGNKIPVSVSGNSYSFTMPSADVRIEVITREYYSGYSLTLAGDIGINYYAAITDEELNNGATVDFSWTVEGVKNTHSITLTAANKTDNGYKASCTVAVAEMTYDVTATLTVGGKMRATDTYSVRRYADTILSDEYKAKYLAADHTEEDYNKLATLVKTMLGYGAMAQLEFDRNIFDLANKGIDYGVSQVTADMITSTASDMDSGLDDYGLAYAGSTIVYLSKTSMRHYYTITDQTKFDAVKDSITFDGVKVDPVEKNGKIYFEKTDIAAADLDTSYTLTIGTNDYNYAVLDYVRACLSSSNVPLITKLLVSATYWYNQAANAYFGR